MEKIFKTGGFNHITNMINEAVKSGERSVTVTGNFRKLYDRR